MNAKVSLACWSLILGVLLSSSGAWAAEPGSQLSGTLDGTSGHVPFGPYGPQGYGPGAYAPEAYGQGAYGPGTFGPGMAPPGGPGMGAYSFADAVAGQEPGGNIGYPVAVPFGPQVAIEGNFSDGLGWLGNYYGARAMIPKHLDPGRSLLFTTIKLSGSDEGGGIINFGQGYRYYSQSQNRIYTLAGFADLDDGHEETYFRLSLHASTQGKFLDINANTYMVLNNFLPGLDGRNVIEDQYYGPLAYQQNLVMSNRRQITETAYGGGEIEAGGRLPFIGRYGISGYAGGYFLQPEEGDSAAGVKLRFEAQVTQDITVGMQYSNDGVFDHNTWMNVSWSFPPGPKHRTFQPKPVRELLAGPVARLDRIQVLTEVEETIEPLTYADGSLITVYHVNGNGLSNGSGTADNPANTLVGTGGQSIILVSGFQVNSAGTAILQNNQRLLGTGLTQTAFSRERGLFVLPGTGTGINPTLFNTTNGNVIQLANNNEVSGFTINGSGSLTGTPGGIGIIGNNITGFNINNSTITNSTDGVSLTNAVGTGIVNLVNFTDNTGVTPNPGVGFRHTVNNGGTSNLTFTNNTATGNGTGALVTASNGSTINVTASNNTFDDNTEPNTGAAFIADGGTINISSFTNNSASNNANGTGFAFIAQTDTGGTPGLITLNNVTGNTASGNGLDGFLVRADSFWGAGTQITGSFGEVGQTANLSEGNGQSGLSLEALNGGTIGTPGGTAFIVQNNQFGQTVANGGAGNGAGGMTIRATGMNGGTNIQVGGPSDAQANLFETNVDYGLGYFTGGNSINRLVVQNNLIQNTTDDAATSTAQDSDGAGIFISRMDSSLQDTLIGNAPGQTGNGNTIINNSGSSILLYGAGNAQFAPDFRPNRLRYADNYFENNANGLRGDLFGEAVFVINGERNSYVNIFVDGVWLHTNDNSSLGDPLTGEASTWRGSMMSGIGVDGFHFEQRDESFGNLFFGADAAGNRLTMRDIGGTGFLLSNSSDVSGGLLPTNTYTIQSVDLDMRDLAGNRNGLDGVSFTQTGARGGTLNIGGNGVNEQVNIRGAGDDGIDGDVSDGIENTINITNTNVWDSGDNGIELEHSGSSALTVNVTNTDSMYNEDRGLEMLISATNPDGGIFTEPPYYSVFNIGDPTDALDRNNFSNNGLQGVVFHTDSTLTFSFFQDFPHSNPAPPNGIQPFPNLGSPGDTVHDLLAAPLVTARLAMTGTNIQFNGTRNVAAGTDGFLATPANNTLAVISIDNVTASGNNGDDLVFQPVIASAGNPIASVNNTPANNATVQDRLVSDPIGQMQLLLGAIDTDADGIPDAISANNGNVVRVSTLGSGTTFGGHTVAGLFTNNDVFKGNNREVRMQLTVFNAVSPDAPANVFIDQLGNLQTFDDGSIGSVFDAANVTLNSFGTFGGPQDSVIYTPLPFPF